MSEIKTYHQAYVPGGFDILHADHKEFISNCVAEAQQFSSGLELLTIGLAPDLILSSKGSNRPFYSFGWRREDLISWWNSTNNPLDINVVDLTAPRSGEKDTLFLLSEEHRKNNFLKGIAGESRQVFISPIDRHHVTDVETLLVDSKNNSNCLLNTIGAVLIRDGMPISASANGGKDDSCLSCSKYTSVQKQFAETGEIKPSITPCDFDHAEAKALTTAQPGDHLISTTSPCNDCAERVMETGIKRMVYIEPYHNLDPIKTLMTAGIEVRMAGAHAT